ncbi:DUF4232 domain-containing protein [Amycolatopsis benzoatilytica]|uniref:DUF4232 domain-containing protein n=1 Tax=Amycolatopsis benzoatilytica TaxID=346045 RepID=UPI00036DB908|nr:DUF4232 domain-containing protein [Amycolatopsis benzoatilytica]
MGIRKTTRTIAAAVAVAGLMAGGAAVFAGTASASSVLPCTASQFTTKLVYGGAGAGNRDAAIQFTAKPGERCYLPGQAAVDLVGAHNVLVNNEAPANAPGVALVDGSSAYVPLHWTAIGGEDEQQTPNGITFTAPADSNPHGDYINPNVTVDWVFGAVDANEGSHTIDVGALTQGEAPAA